MIKEICGFLGIRGLKVDESGLNSDHIVMEDEPWKHLYHNKIQKQDSRKFDTVFSARERKYIMKKLSAINI